MKTIWKSFVSTALAILRASSNQQHKMATTAPLYITIGPPCAGKTTWIRQQQPKTVIKDVSIDDQPGVYVPLPRHYFLSSCEDQEKQQGEVELDRVMNGRSIRERIQTENTELRCILERLEGITSATTCRSTLLQQARNPNGTEALTALADVVEEFTASSATVLPSKVDLFIREALATAIPSAERSLRSTPSSSAVAWGNTNTRPTDYEKALEWASTQRRPVHFVLYTEDEEHKTNNKDYFLYAESARTLLRRSIRRLLQTGRYVPAPVVWDMRARCLQMTNNNNNSNNNNTLWERDASLARLAQGTLQSDRTVSVVPQSAMRKRPYASQQQQQQHRPYSTFHGSQQQQRQPDRPHYQNTGHYHYQHANHNRNASGRDGRHWGRDRGWDHGGGRRQEGRPHWNRGGGWDRDESGVGRRDDRGGRWDRDEPRRDDNGRRRDADWGPREGQQNGRRNSQR